ncbi:DNA methyltransferase [Microbacterium laevaniformans]|uniref:DNA methyltransferase n=1 Tax=Microbacterium laevaniformans TaxID=36807 RepID=UPI003D98B17E
MTPGASSPHPSHLIAIGDNAAVLPRLHADLAGAVDLVYIDPPYDHGDGGRRASQKRFAYEDRRQGDWAGFIRDRLELAKPLLATHAPVAASIGHRRVHELARLMADVFTGYEIVTITIDLRRAPADRLGVQRIAEYLLIAVPADVRLGAPGLTKGETRNGWNGFALSGYTAEQYPNQVYPLLVDKATRRIVEIGPSVKTMDANFEAAVDVPDGCVPIWPITRDGKDAVWRVARETAVQLHADGMLRAQKPHMPGNVQPFTIQYVTTGTRKRITSGEIGTHGLDNRGALIIDRVAPAGAGVPSIWRGEGYETRAGTERLDELIGPDHGFAYPKPPMLVADVIRATTNGNTAAVVLDFFAGSGTTLDAVCALNSADGGTRRAILVQQEEDDIVDRVLIPRARAVVAGADIIIRR